MSLSFPAADAACGLEIASFSAFDAEEGSEAVAVAAKIMDYVCRVILEIVVQVLIDVCAQTRERTKRWNLR
jgi:hypothetical protein